LPQNSLKSNKDYVKQGWYKKINQHTSAPFADAQGTTSIAGDKYATPDPD
jgi:hypothetical protein